MIAESLIRHVCCPEQDALEQAKAKVQTRQVAAVIAERKARVHSALARSIPTEGLCHPAAHRVQA